MFDCFLRPLARSKYLSLFSLSLIFTMWSADTAKSTRQQVFFFFIVVNFNFLHSSQWITFLTQSCLVLYSFFTLIYSMRLLCDWLFHLSQHITYINILLRIINLSIFELILLVIMALFCTVIRRNSVSFLMFPFRSHVQVFMWNISFVCRLKYSYSCFPSHFYSLFNVVLSVS